MTIALIAHDSKKELMVQFCTAYCRILSQNQLVATGTTGKLIAEATGLPVKRFLSGKQGGDQQIAARIACNEIDLLIFFRDPINAKPSEPNEMTLLRLCDVHNIPMATPDSRPGAGRPGLAEYCEPAPGLMKKHEPRCPGWPGGSGVLFCLFGSAAYSARQIKPLPTTAPSR